MVLLSFLRGWWWVAGWLGGRRADSVSPLQPFWAIYHLSALVFQDIKQVSWEAARGLEALSWAVWGIAAPRGLCEAYPTEGLWDKPEQQGCGQGPWFLHDHTEAGGWRSSCEKVSDVPGSTQPEPGLHDKPCCFPLHPPPPLSQGVLTRASRSLWVESKNVDRKKKIPQLCSLTSDYSYKFYFFQLQM